VSIMVSNVAAQHFSAVPLSKISILKQALTKTSSRALRRRHLPVSDSFERQTSSRTAHRCGKRNNCLAAVPQGHQRDDASNSQTLDCFNIGTIAVVSPTNGLSQWAVAIC